MLELNSSVFIYALFTAMLLSTGALLAVLGTLKQANYHCILSMRLFKVYFFLGFIGWTIDIITVATSGAIPLKEGGIFYIIASSIFFIAMFEKKLQNEKIRFIFLLYITLFIISMIIANNDHDLLIILSLFTLFTYGCILCVGLKPMLDLDNIGFKIIFFAVFLAVIASLAQIYVATVYSNTNLGHTIAFTVNASGYLLIATGFLTSILISEHKQLKALALKDPLTDLYNRRGLDHVLQTIVPAAKRYQKCLSIIAIDIDFFKSINDTYGHSTGDLVLKAFAQALKQYPRQSDVPCRLGGEEFAIVLPETELPDALIVAEKIRKEVEVLEILANDKTIELTASFGVATSCEDVDIDNVLKNADKALYSAKNEGRNCVRFSDL